MYLIVSNQFNRLRLYHRLLRVNDEIQQRVQSTKLIVANGTNRLFTHGTLICITRRLIVMRIRNKSSDSTENRKRFDLEMSGLIIDLRLVHCDRAVIFL